MASLAEGPATAAAVPTAGGGSACSLCLPPPPPPGPPLRDPGSQKAPSVRGHLQPEPAGGGRGPARDGQCPQGATRGETHLGLTGCGSSTHEVMSDFYLEIQGHLREPVGTWPAPSWPWGAAAGTGTLLGKYPLCWQPLPLPHGGLRKRGALRAAEGAWQGGTHRHRTCWVLPRQVCGCAGQAGPQVGARCPEVCAHADY